MTKNNNKPQLSSKIEQVIAKVQKILDRDLMKDIGTLKMTALTHFKYFLIQSQKYAKSYEKHCENDESV